VNVLMYGKLLRVADLTNRCVVGMLIGVMKKEEKGRNIHTLGCCWLEVRCRQAG